ncbi:hypothetical protein CBR_g78864 [Chara braunii]|uniref:Uncharacterized protein n=1 Tax=Chara braunii TaxID=69332 RepID=A0A388KAV6_CHABU|nr:hypothetical protein CBR_g78864 [Chara braunii]|eukprot:GBG67083.1 hypothetical protein CBR_g78864 [Chara braunii]
MTRLTVTAMTMVMMTMMAMPLRVLAAVGADGSLTTERGRESGSRVVFTATNPAYAAYGTRECFIWVRDVVFTSERGVFFYVHHDSCWNTTSGAYVRGGRSLRKGDLRGIASSGDAQGNSSVVTLQWSQASLNATAAIAADSLGKGSYADFWGFDLSRSEGHLVAPVIWGLAFVNTMDGSRTTFPIADFGCTFGAFNPNRTILYVGNRGCLVYSVMDGESPESFVDNFKPLACPTDTKLSSLSFGHRSFLQDGSYLYARDDSNAKILGFNLLSGIIDRGTGTEIGYVNRFRAIPSDHLDIYNLRELVVTQDGCNLFFVEDGGTEIMRVGFTKPRGEVTSVERVASCIVPGGCVIGTLALDNDDSHLYVSIHTGRLFELQINKSGLHRCIGALSAPAAYASSSPMSSSEASPSPSSSDPSTGVTPSPSSSEPSTESSPSPSSSEPSTDGSQEIHPSPAMGSSSSPLHNYGNNTRVGPRSSDALSTSPPPVTVQTPPRRGVSISVMAGVVVAVCLISLTLGGTAVLLYSRTRESARAASGDMSARAYALDRPVAKSSSLELPVAQSSALERPM